MAGQGEPGPRVLLVDDEPNIRAALRDLLVDEGVDVVGEADDGARGVVLATELEPDVVLMDLRMPVMSGTEAARQVKEALPMTQVIMLSAYDDPALKDASERAGVYAYLVKGCSARVVLDALMKAWELKSGLEARARET